MSLLKFKLPSLVLSSFLTLFIAAVPPSFAAVLFSFAPISNSFAPSGRGASQAYTVTNTSPDKILTVQIYATTREIGLNGEETNNQEKAEADFVIYPPQVILKPGETQLVRVSWLGDPNPPKELTYRLIAEQLPVDTDTQTTTTQGRTIGITTLIRYAASVYITPPNAAPEAIVESATHQKSKTGTDQLVLTLENKGTAHLLLNDLIFTLTPKNQPDKTLITEELPGVTGENMLAGIRRRFVIPWPKNLPVGELTVTFKPKANL
jgi:fimbrial chaperone protein